MATIKCPGSVLEIGDAETGSTTWVTIGEVKSYDYDGGSVEETDITTIAETQSRSFRPLLFDPGSITFDMNFDPDDAGQVDIDDIVFAQGKRQWVWTFPEGTSKYLTFTGHVTTTPSSAPLGGIATAGFTVRLSTVLSKTSTDPTI